MLTLRRISVHYLTGIFYFDNYHKPFVISPVGIHVSIFVVIQSLSSVWFFAALWTATRQAPCPSSSLGIRSNSHPLCRSCHPTASSSATSVSSCPQSFLASGSFPVSGLFTSGDQSIGASVSASVLPKSIQGLFPLGLTGLISVLPKELSRVVSSSMMLKHQFFSAQPSSWSNSHIHTWLLEKPYLELYRHL